MTYPRWRFRLSLFALVLISALATFSLQAQTTPEPTGDLLVVPASGVPGTLHLIFAEDLTANTIYQLEISHSETDEVLLSTELTAANNGSISYNFSSDAATPPGSYNVTLSQAGEVVSSSTLTIEGETQSSSGNLLVAPASGAPGSLHLIRAEDLTPNTNYQLVITNLETATPLLSTNISSDGSGIISYNFTTSATAPAGNYDVVLISGAQIVAMGSLTVEAVETPEVTAATTLAPTETATVTSSPTPAATETEPAVTESPDTNGDTLSPGAPITGELTADSSGGEYTFTGLAGEVVIIRLESADFDAYLLLLDEDGNTIIRNDNGAGNFNAEISGFALPSDGTYTVVATSRTNLENNEAESTGSYTLTLNTAREANSGEITSGETIIGTITADSEVPQYTFTAQPGDTLTIDLASDDFDPFLVLAFEGNQVATDDDSGPSLYARLERIVITEAGEYTIIVDGFRGQTGERAIEGDYRLTLRIEGEEAAVFQPTQAPTEDAQPTEEATEAPTDEAPDETTTPDAGTEEGEATPEPVAYGDTVESELTEDIQTALYEFEGGEGDDVTIALNSDDFDPLLILLDSAGNELTRDDDAGPGVYSLIEGFALPADDTYTIVVDGYRGVNGDRLLSGVFTLSLTSGDAVIEPTEESTTEAPTEEVTPDETTTPDVTVTPEDDDVTPTALPTLEGTIGVISAGETVSGDLTGDAQIAQYTFTANAGDLVTIDLISDDFDPFVLLRNVEGRVIAEDDDSGGNSQARIEAFELPEDGEYTIVIDAFRGFSGTQTVNGSYTLTLMIEAAIEEATPTATPTDEATAEDTTPTPDAAVTITITPTAEATLAATTLPGLPPLAFDPFEAEAKAIDLGEEFEIEFIGIPDEPQVFGFEGNAGDAISVYGFSQGEIDTILRLYAPDGTEIAVDDDSGQINDPEIQQVMLEQDGEYRLVVQPYVNGAQGTFTLFVTDLPPFEWDGNTITYSVADKIAGYSPLVFEADEGETLRLVVRRLDFAYQTGTTTITVTQNGTVLAQNEIGFGAGLAIDFNVPEDGEIIISFGFEGVGGSVLEVTLQEAE